MRAMVFRGPGQAVIEEHPDPTPGPKDVVMKVKAVGLCGTDLHVLDGEFAPAQYPLVPGHEATGTVSAVGSDVTRFKVGDKVVLNVSVDCGQCQYCDSGRGNLCENWDGVGVAREWGALSEQYLAPEKRFIKLQDSTDLDEAAFIEPLACAVHGFDVLPRKMGSHYLIYGSGTMGLIMAQLARTGGAATVSIIDINTDRLETAKELGFELLAKSADEFDRTKWDVVIDCTGVIPAIQDGLERVARGGVFQHFGVAASEATATYKPFKIFEDELTIIGSMAVAGSFHRAVELFEGGAINVKPMISHKFKLDQYAEAVEMFRKGQGRKLQIHPNL
jgi:2-desacetyl-2-hydroxyethyl bacteriochlorophyllide A dehydrogenase